MIRAYAEQHDGRKIEEDFGAASITIGRGFEADLIIQDPRASKEHAKVKVEAGRLVLIDLKSSNGTLVNGRPVQEPVVLNPGDEVKIGRTRIFFELIDDLDTAAESPEDDTVEDVLFEDLAQGEAASEPSPADLIEQPLTLSVPTRREDSTGEAPTPDIQQETHALGRREPQPEPPERSLRPPGPDGESGTLIVQGRMPRPAAAAAGEETPDAPAPLMRLMKHIAERVREVCSVLTLTVGFVESHSNLPVGPFYCEAGKPALRVELVRKSVSQRQALLAEISGPAESRTAVLCLPICSAAGPVGFVYATAQPGTDLSAILPDAMAAAMPFAEAMACARELSSSPAAHDLDIARHIQWHIGECKRSLFMMASGISQNNMAHVRAGHDNMKRLIHYFESMALNLEYLNAEGRFPLEECDLRQIARVTADAVTEMAAEHFITVSCRVAGHPLPVRVSRRLLEAALCTLMTSAIMRAREADELQIEAGSPDSGETAWFSLRLPLHLAANRAAFENEIALRALRRVASDWSGAMECAPDAENYIIRISFPCVRAK